MERGAESQHEDWRSSFWGSSVTRTAEARDGPRVTLCGGLRTLETRLQAPHYLTSAHTWAPSSPAPPTASPPSLVRLLVRTGAWPAVGLEHVQGHAGVDTKPHRGRGSWAACRLQFLTADLSCPHPRAEAGGFWGPARLEQRTVARGPPGPTGL